VVAAVVLAGALDRLDVERLLDDADALGVALRIGADAAGVDGGDRVAPGAVEEAFLDLEQRLGEGRRLRLGDLEDVVRQAGGGLRPDAGEAGELADQPGQRIARLVDLPLRSAAAHERGGALRERP